MGKVYIEKNVLQAAQERIKFLFDNFDNIVISFSGGKDSGVCLNLCYDYAVSTGQTEKLVLWFKDEEVIHTETLRYVERVFKGYEAIKRKYWLCLPLRERYPNSATCYEWKAWDLSEKSKWVREYPETPYLITQQNCPFPFKVGDDIHDIGDNICKYTAKSGSACQVVGLRAGESFRRTMVVLSNKRTATYKGEKWTTQHKYYVSAYPLYDWTNEDLWVANGRFGWDYNKIYDLYYYMGLTLKQMRVSTPFHESGQKMLGFWKKTDPLMWNKITQRVEGITFAALYTNTSALNKNITLPTGYTWYTYKQYLLSTLPPITKNRLYEKVGEKLNSENEEVCKSVCKAIMCGDWSGKHILSENKVKKIEEERKERLESKKKYYLQYAKGVRNEESSLFCESSTNRESKSE